MNDLREADSVFSGRLSHVPNSLAVISNPQGMPSRDQSSRPEKEQPGISGKRFLIIHFHQFLILGRNATYGDPVKPSSSEPVVSLLYGRHPPSRYDGSVFVKTSTENPVAREEEQNRDTVLTPRLVIDRQPDIVTLCLKQCTHRIIWLTQGCKFPNLILTNFLHHLHFRGGKQD